MSDKDKKIYGIAAISTIVFLVVSTAIGGPFDSLFSYLAGKGVADGNLLGYVFTLITLLIPVIAVWYKTGSVPGWWSIVAALAAILFIADGGLRLTGIISPPAYTAKGTNWLMNPIKGDIFKAEPQTGCQARKDCFDPNHSTPGKQGGTTLVAFSQAKLDAIKKAQQAQRKKPCTSILGCSGSSSKKSPRAAKVSNCKAVEFSSFANCKRVTLLTNRHGSDPYVFLKSNPRNCTSIDDMSGINHQKSGETFTFSLQQGQVLRTFHVFERHPGQSYKNGKVCGS